MHAPDMIVVGKFDPSTGSEVVHCCCHGGLVDLHEVGDMPGAPVPQLGETGDRDSSDGVRDRCAQTSVVEEVEREGR